MREMKVYLGQQDAQQENIKAASNQPLHLRSDHLRYGQRNSQTRSEPGAGKAEIFTGEWTGRHSLSVVDRIARGGWLVELYQHFGGLYEIICTSTSYLDPCCAFLKF
jgi:hypothetical protein